MGEEIGPVVMRSQENSDEDEEYDYKIDPYEDYNEAEYPVDIGGTSNAASPGSSSYDEDPEYFAYECLEIIDVERLLNESVEKIYSAIPVTPALAKILLHTHKWNTESIVQRYKRDYMQLLIDTKLKPKKLCPPLTSLLTRSSALNSATAAAAAAATDCRYCPVCITPVTAESFQHLSCGHLFCISCWRTHIKIQLSIGISTAMECMESECHLLVPEDFVLKILTVPDLRAKYEQFVFQDLVKSNPELKFCPGPDCTCVIRAKIPRAKKVVCKQCRTCFCFVCGIEYHAPTDCDTMKKWLIKCADDSETANYITANTKDCPGCHICIEKSGGCNHMQCWKCKHHFCWMCLGDWKNHGSEYYECSRYKENPNIANESAHTKARKALEKYLFYFERWENHYKSLKLEEKMLEKIKKRIDEKVNKHEGTWIDWQYLYNAAALLTKCRYTLQYTYPYAYYMEPGCRKELFEYQQAQLEREIENLSWKVERAESTDRGDMENQMHIAELKRLTLLKDFLL